MNSIVLKSFPTLVGARGELDESNIASVPTTVENPSEQVRHLPVSLSVSTTQTSKLSSPTASYDTSALRRLRRENTLQKGGENVLCPFCQHY